MLCTTSSISRVCILFPSNKQFPGFIDIPDFNGEKGEVSPQEITSEGLLNQCQRCFGFGRFGVQCPLTIKCPQTLHKAAHEGRNVQPPHERTKTQLAPEGKSDHLGHEGKSDRLLVLVQLHPNTKRLQLPQPPLSLQ